MRKEVGETCNCERAENSVASKSGRRRRTT
jgi:hypothetical protein